IELARKVGAQSVHVSFVHPILAGGALEKIKKMKPESIIGSNTMESSVSIADVTPEIIELLKNVRGE
ncbi:MAG: hypothetical protein GOV00_03420, partial [Candidatus Altiarchaeota archaeon]|nr:hypothetical protein [Candidatus Altiarchaeota archaeon]